MKKFFSLVLALVMALSLTTVAWGATVLPPADADGVIDLTEDVELSTTYVLTEDTVINLNGYDLSSTVDMFRVENGYSLTINGTGEETISAPANMIIIKSYGNGTNANEIVLDNVKITTAACAIYHNGTTFGADVTIDTSVIEADTAGTGVYLSGQASWGADKLNELFINDSVISGDTAVEVKHGDITVIDSTLTALGTAQMDNYSNGTCSYGYALALTNNGGTSSHPTEASVGTVFIAGGTFTGAVGIKAADATTEVGNVEGGASITISSGTFTDDVSAYLVDGLTQTADGIVVSDGGTVLGTTYDMVSTDSVQYKIEGVTVSTFSANKPKDTDKDGLLDQEGNVKYVEFSYMPGIAFVQVNTVGEADYTVYQAGTKTVFGYFKYVWDPYYLGNGVAFYDFGENCGQYDETPEVGEKYYLFQGDLYQAVDPDEVFPDANLMVGGALTPVVEMDDEFVDHVPAFTYDKDYKVIAVKCAECGTPAVLYANYAAVPKADKAVAQGPINDNDYYVWLDGPVADAETEDPKVESADTFDAGIAMYVGMSIMAAAGGAVVIGKKKD